MYELDKKMGKETVLRVDDQSIFDVRKIGKEKCKGWKS